MATLTLRVGLPGDREGQKIFYKVVKLREVDVADERWAVRMAERLVLWQGEPKLVISGPDHKLALTVRHIEEFICPGVGKVTKDEIDLDLIGKLKPVDLAAIEERVFLMELALKVRYGEMTQEQFDAYLKASSPEDDSPQPVGPTAHPGEPSAGAGSGPVMLADHTGSGAAGAPSSLAART